MRHEHDVSGQDTHTNTAGTEDSGHFPVMHLPVGIMTLAAAGKWWQFALAVIMFFVIGIPGMFVVGGAWMGGFAFWVWLVPWHWLDFVGVLFGFYAAMLAVLTMAGILIAAGYATDSLVKWLRSRTSAGPRKGFP